MFIMNSYYNILSMIYNNYIINADNIITMFIIIIDI